MSKIILTTASCLLLFIAGCTKWNCCGYPYYNYLCVKGTDTISVYIAPGPNVHTNSVDSLSSYQNDGYACFTDNRKERWRATVGCFGSGLKLKHEKDAGLECLDYKFGDFCNSTKCGE